MINIIKRAIITEKTINEAKKGIFTFEVALKSNKAEIKKNLEKMMSVHVTKVKTEILKGKMKTTGRKRLKKKLPDLKKARVMLKKGEKIDMSEMGKTT